MVSINNGKTFLYTFIVFYILISAVAPVYNVVIAGYINKDL